ncbi:CDK-activating kinase assembly factor MAT1 [Seminavis robusta]|uniref:CDK-activating kinase assembly factor MAT1 n=1 Tax=Seminavis robusta TaxID=568900 RepID=A0A9N8HVK5_9STRA|nr:CDK-activating kinase assembly factor MAT1 [Seminavis robusta]|eukprot:Sro1823_g299890.1 CDK-activating kinase assembly factor MAT1 (296) ;mRNA; f:6606-7677
MDQEQDDLFRCAICGVTETDASNLSSQNALQTNATVRCGHKFCNSCIERELSRKREFPCPICRTRVKRVTLSYRSLDDVLCEKDTDWRRRVMKVFNKSQADFPTLLEYNNYLEEKEDIVFSIVNEEPNAEEAKDKIRAYEEEHKALIVLRQSQRADEERSIQDRIAAEQREMERKKRELKEEEKLIAMTKRKYKQEATEVLLGEREEVSAELVQAQMMGYRNELKRQSQGAKATQFVSPKVREPKGGFLPKEPKQDREFHRKRQAAGGGIRSGSIAPHEKNWNETEASLFATCVQ